MSDQILTKPLVVISILLFGLIIGVSFGAGVQELQTNHQMDTLTQPDVTEKQDLTFTEGSQPGGVVQEETTGTTTQTGSFNELQRAISGTVTIYMEINDQTVGQGSGFVYKDDYIMTNNHVIFGGNEITQETVSDATIHIEYSDGSWSTAELVGGDKYSDIAVVKPQTIPESAPTLTLSESLPKQGERVYAIGAPYGYNNSLTSGIISATGRSTFVEDSGFTIPDTIQTDAEIDQGNSGGPLVVQRNETTVVGINRAKSGDSIGFAISSRLADRVGTELIESGEYEHNYVGFVGLELNPTIPQSEQVEISNGIVVTQVTENSPSTEKFTPATEDSIEDVIVSVNGQDVDNMEELSRLLTLNFSPGDTVQFTIYNDGETRTERITLAERPDSL